MLIPILPHPGRTPAHLVSGLKNKEN